MGILGLNRFTKRGASSNHPVVVVLFKNSFLEKLVRKIE
jgi:hypothetical protein